MHQYQEQLHRVERWLERIKHPGDDRDLNEDYLWSFFQNCWHLKDWIVNDHVAGQSGAVLEIAIAQYDSLKIVQGLALHSKHLELDYDRAPAKDPRVRKARMVGDVSVYIGRNPYSKVSYRVYDDSKKDWIPVLELAEQAVNDWKQILTDRVLEL